MVNIVSLIPLFPLLGFLFAAFFGKRTSKSIVGIVASGMVLFSFICSGYLFYLVTQAGFSSETISLFSWIKAGGLEIAFSFLVDPLSCLFLLIITGIGFLIHIYSIGYMHNDKGFHRFFAYLNLFVFFMLLLVLGSNYLIMFVGWEGVGLCSYLLIGFWFKNQSYNNAAKKAFIINRIGDLGFLLGIMLIYLSFGSINYSDVFLAAKYFPSNEFVIVAITSLLFIGAMGKSAQIPLYTWLPDAMAGPTPVSALIHAATMVTAGIYMIARSNILYTIAPISQEFIVVIGATTALFAACIALFQTDIKKVLAYSTVSQLGLMFVGLGVGAYTAAVFHVTTHAFFKALLFLGSGSVIHAMGGEQDIRNMGGLKNKLPVTFITFMIGTIAISGIPPLSGFFSKDEILANAFGYSKLIWGLGLITSLLTAFYMFRLLYLTFYGSFRGTIEQQKHLHESPSSMTIPLVVLAFLSIFGGFIGLPESFHLKHLLKEFLAPVFSDSAIKSIPHILSHEAEYLLMFLAVLVAGVAVYFAWLSFVKKAQVPTTDEFMRSFQKIAYNKFYIDESYAFVITKPLNTMSRFFNSVIENGFIDYLVTALGKQVNVASNLLKALQTGEIGSYLFLFIIGVACLLFSLLY